MGFGLGLFLFSKWIKRLDSSGVKRSVNPSRDHRFIGAWLGIVLCISVVGHANASRQFLVVNLHPDQVSDAGFEQVCRLRNHPIKGPVDLGAGAIFSYLNMPRPTCEVKLKTFLSLSRAHDLPIVVQLDGEQWWSARPDLWNWWDPNAPGYHEENRKHVEWTGWSADEAIKIGWRNWGRQIRVLPPPNLMSSAYRKACHDEMRVLIPMIVDWYDALPADKKHLLIGIKLGWESAIGVNTFYYPDGNSLLDRPAQDDPVTGLDHSTLPSRGVTAIGYAAVSTADIAQSGQLRESDLAEVVRRHLNDLCYQAFRLEVPRDKLFTHIGGWKDEELLYDAALNRYACPGFSFYTYAHDPTKDKGVQRVLEKSDAPYWAAVEWLIHSRDARVWSDAFRRTLADPKCRYLCIYNYSSIKDNPAAVEAIGQVLAEGGSH